MNRPKEEANYPAVGESFLFERANIILPRPGGVIGITELFVRTGAHSHGRIIDIWGSPAGIRDFACIVVVQLDRVRCAPRIIELEIGEIDTPFFGLSSLGFEKYGALGVELRGASLTIHQNANHDIAGCLIMEGIALLI